MLIVKGSDLIEKVKIDWTNWVNRFLQLEHELNTKIIIDRYELVKKHLSLDCGSDRKLQEFIEELLKE